MKMLSVRTYKQIYLVFCISVFVPQRSFSGSLCEKCCPQKRYDKNTGKTLVKKIINTNTNKKEIINTNEKEIINTNENQNENVSENSLLVPGSNNWLFLDNTDEEVFAQGKKTFMLNYEQQERLIADKNLYRKIKDDDFYEDLRKEICKEKKSEVNIDNICSVENKIPELKSDTKKNQGVKNEKEVFISSMSKDLHHVWKDLIIFTLKGGEPNGNLLDPTEIRFFNSVKSEFLNKIPNDRGFKWHPNKNMSDTGGPARFLLSTFYSNLLTCNVMKLEQFYLDNVEYVLFKSKLQQEDCNVLGELAFLSLSKKAKMEYNFPLFYYKIMLHLDEKLEDFLTLSDLKRALAIRKQSQDGKFIWRHDFFTQVDIQVNPKKDNVYLKHIPEEVYLLFLKLTPQEMWVDFDTFKNNFTQNVCDLLCCEKGIQIQSLLSAFVDGFQKRFESIVPYCNFLKKELAQSNNKLLWLSLVKKYNLSAENLRDLLQGDQDLTLDKLMSHFCMVREEENFTLEDVKEIILSVINEKKWMGTEQKNFFKRISWGLTGSLIPFGTVTISLFGKNIIEYKVSTCDKKLYLHWNDPKKHFKTFLEEQCLKNLSQKNFYDE